LPVASEQFQADRKRRSSRFRARLNKVPMYFSNIASVASDRRVSRLAA